MVSARRWICCTAGYPYGVRGHAPPDVSECPRVWAPLPRSGPPCSLNAQGRPGTFPIDKGYRRRTESSQRVLQVLPGHRSTEDTAPPIATSMSDTLAVLSGLTPPQSIDSYMKALQQLLPSLPAGATVFMVGITLPAANGAVANTSALPLVDGAGETARSDVPAPMETKRGQAVPESSVARTPLEILRAERRERPNRMRKTAEWAGLLGTSARALRRAVEAGAISYEAKPDGRDHGAIVIRPEVLEAYLATVDAVERGQCDPPEWWNRVFGKKAWAHSA